MQPASQVDLSSTYFGLTDSEIEPVISRYFETLNAGDFQSTAALFAIDGKLYPPMENAIVGREAIEAYLSAEAKGMQLIPLERSITQETDQTRCQAEGQSEYQVAGKVQTPFFSVNVAWKFILNDRAKIVSVKVKLLAALEELINLKF